MPASASRPFPQYLRNCVAPHEYPPVPASMMIGAHASLSRKKVNAAKKNRFQSAVSLSGFRPGMPQCNHELSDQWRFSRFDVRRALRVGPAGIGGKDKGRKSEGRE